MSAKPNDPGRRPGFFGLPRTGLGWWSVGLALGAAAAATAGAIAGLLAIVVKRERSFMILLSVLLGTLVLVWTIGELDGDPSKPLPAESPPPAAARLRWQAGSRE